MCYGDCVPISNCGHKINISKFDKNYYFKENKRIESHYVQIMLQMKRFLFFDAANKSNKPIMNNSLPLVLCKNSQYLTYLFLMVFLKFLIFCFSQNVCKYLLFNNS